MTADKYIIALHCFGHWWENSPLREKGVQTFFFKFKNYCSHIKRIVVLNVLGFNILN